jgi:hypothetical protein
MKRIVRPAALLVALCLAAAVAAGPAAAAGSTTTTPTAANAAKAKAKAKKHNSGKHKASATAKHKARGGTRITPNGRVIVGYPKGANAGLDFTTGTVAFGDAAPAALAAASGKASGQGKGGGGSGSGSSTGQGLVILAGVLLLAGLFGVLRSIVHARATRGASAGDAAPTT